MTHPDESFLDQVRSRTEDVDLDADTPPGASEVLQDAPEPDPSQEDLDRPLAPYGPPIPTPPSEFEAEGEPDPGYTDPLVAATGMNQDYDVPYPDVYQGADEFGTLPSEQQSGEPLELRLERELPDDEAFPADDPGSLEDHDRGATQDTSVHSPDLPRLVEDDMGTGTDFQKELQATRTLDRDGLSAEESAMHLEPEDDLSGTFGDAELYAE